MRVASEICFWLRALAAVVRPTSGAFLSSGKLVLEGDGKSVQKQVHLQILDGNVGCVGIAKLDSHAHSFTAVLQDKFVTCRQK